MRLAYLTTRTLHHAWFLREIHKIHNVGLALVQTGAVTAPFAVDHPFEAKREHFEREKWFSTQAEDAAWNVPLEYFKDLNEDAAILRLRAFRPDAVIVFGTGRLCASLINICPQGIVNLHGGDPEQYRGLDTHLWAIYHKDPAGLVVTLHAVDTGIDTGSIIETMPIPLRRGMCLSELRAATTETCLTLVQSALHDFEKCQSFPSRPQQKVGRYYSHMPACLKEICIGNFRRIVEKTCSAC